MEGLLWVLKWMSVVSLGLYVLSAVVTLFLRSGMAKEKARIAELKERARREREAQEWAFAAAEARLHDELCRIVNRRPRVDRYRLVTLTELAREPGSRLSRN